MSKARKIGIVTIPDITNYGNRLQNYAVSHILRDRFGCKAVSLVSRREKPFENGNYVLWLKNFIARRLCVFPRLAEKRFGGNMTRWANFYSWNKRNIPTRTFYGQLCLPQSVNEEYDMFFAGSDQIWNWRFPNTKYDDYFLKFAQGSKKAALSGSFGVEEIHPERRQFYSESLADFAHLSVREEAGASLIKDLTGRDVPVLVDPVMLLTREEWLKVARPPRTDISRPYILKYYLGDEEGEDKLDTWAAERGYAVYELHNENIPELYSAGPGEFISLMANAALVASDSFHSIAFAIVFRKPFVVYERRGAEDYMTSRLDTLLGKFGFRHRWKHLLGVEDYIACDHSRTDTILAREREKALEFIQKVLRSA